jgi:hypothetical protein
MIFGSENPYPVVTGRECGVRRAGGAYGLPLSFTRRSPHRLPTSAMGLRKEVVDAFAALGLDTVRNDAFSDERALSDRCAGRRRRNS